MVVSGGSSRPRPGFQACRVFCWGCYKITPNRARREAFAPSHALDTLKLTFADSSTGIVDGSRWVLGKKPGVFAPLRDPALFAQVYVDHEGAPLSGRMMSTSTPREPSRPSRPSRPALRPVHPQPARHARRRDPADVPRRRVRYRSVRAPWSRSWTSVISGANHFLAVGRSGFGGVLLEASQ